MACTEMGGSDEDPIMDFGKPGDSSLMRMYTHTPWLNSWNVTAWWWLKQRQKVSDKI